VLGAPFAGRRPGSSPGSERTEVGEVYVVFGSGDLSGEVSIPTLEQDVTLSGSQGRPLHGQFGAAVASADVNGDDVDDIIVGAYRSNGPDGKRPASGAAYVFFGGSGLKGRLSIADNQQGVTILGKENASLGLPIVTGDFNGDGTADVALGARLENSGQLSALGAVHILFGGSVFKGTIDLAQAAADVTITGSQPGELVPTSMDAADLNGDGADDLIIGSPLSDAPEGRRAAGRAYIILGGSDIAGGRSLTGQQDLTVVGVGERDGLGASVAAAEVGDDDVVYLILMAASPVHADSAPPEPGKTYVIKPDLP